MCRATELQATMSDGAASPLAWFGAMLDHCYDFAEAAKAHARMESSEHVGKIVLTV